MSFFIFLLACVLAVASYKTAHKNGFGGGEGYANRIHTRSRVVVVVYAGIS